MAASTSLKLSRSISTNLRSVKAWQRFDGLPERSARMPTTKGNSFLSIASPGSNVVADVNSGGPHTDELVIVYSVPWIVSFLLAVDCLIYSTISNLYI